MASINMSDLSSLPIGHNFHKKTPKKNKVEFVKQLQPVDLRSDTSHIKTHSCCSDSNKHTHSHIYAPILFHWRGREACCTHTQGRVEGRREGSPQVKVFRLIVCGDCSFTKTRHYATMKANKHRDQWITAVCNLAGGLEVDVRSWGGESRMSEVDGSLFESFTFHRFTFEYQPALWTKCLKNPVTAPTMCYKQSMCGWLLMPTVI